VECRGTGTLPADWHQDRRQRFTDVETVATLLRNSDGGERAVLILAIVVSQGQA